MTTTQRTESAAGRLSRELIVATALRQIDASGVQSLSMRSLAQALGVEAMSLYRYVHGREDLLEGVVDALTRGLTDGLNEHLRGHWQGYLQTLAHQVRRIAIDHPRAFPLLATRHPAAPWLRPPLRSIELVNDFLEVLIGQGFSDEQAVKAYRSFTSVLLGLLLLEAASRGAAPEGVDMSPDDGDGGGSESADRAALSEAPEVLRLKPLLSEDTSSDEFEAALEDLVDRIAREIAP